MGYCLETSVGPFVLYIAPINVKPGRGGWVRGGDFCWRPKLFVKMPAG